MTPRLLPQTSLTGNLILLYKSLYFQLKSTILRIKTGPKAQEFVEFIEIRGPSENFFQDRPNHQPTSLAILNHFLKTPRVSHCYTGITYFGLKKPLSLAAERTQGLWNPSSQKHYKNPYQVGCKTALTASSTTKISKPCLRISGTKDLKISLTFYAGNSLKHRKIPQVLKLSSRF